MEKSYKPIIEHIPHFLNYCKKRSLSKKTQENYKRYLNKFILWLKKENKNDILPHEFNAGDILKYKLYLSEYKDEKGQSLKKITQHYYLIALRALLSYFIAKDIVALPVDKITLPKDVKRERTVKFLNLEQIEKLLLTPNAKTLIGLRDRAILAVLISSGLKVAQLKALNRNQLEQNVPGEAFVYVKEYLETREDNDESLFIHFRSRKGVENRLIARSIERIVQKYGKKINFPFSITPETLRWARALALLNKEVEIEIQETQTHQILTTENYKNSNLSFFDRKKLQNLSPTWHNIENLINQEVTWLKSNIPVLPGGYKENPPFLKCDDCILRKIAILIISGKVGATEIRAEENKDLWNNLTENMNFKKTSRHGEEWHRKMMDVIYEYFKLQNYKIVFEPILNYGRADLGVYSKLNKTLYIEVDTVSLFKLWYNFSTMKNATFLIILSENKVIEFNT